MGLTRRDLLTLGIGAAAAVPFTPIPWKLIDDTAKWSQNWSWIPRPPRGERSVRYGSCTLCSAGCGIQAKCVGKNVIGIAPVAAHPVSRGVLCPYAFGAHQLPYHAARITRPLHGGNPVSMDKAAAEISARVKGGTIAIVDERPGRAVSAAYQRIAAARGGLYLAANRGTGLDLENVRTLVSFGAPVLESWATPGRVLTLWKDDRLAIVQIEAELSKTAALASHWLPVRAGSEPHIAQLLAGTTSLSAAAEATGIAADRLTNVLRFIHDRGPMLVVSGGELAEPALPEASVDVLFVDHGQLGGAIPYASLRRKLRPDGIVVSLSPYRAGASALAAFVIPTPAFGESLDEAPTPWDAVSPSYALAPALVDPPPGVTTALDFINRVTGGEVTAETAIRTRVGELHTAKRGDVFTFADRSTKPLSSFKSPADLYKAFNAGACWVGPRFSPAASTCGTFTRGTAVAPPLWRPQHA